MKIALIGATGLVGRVMLKVLEERNLPITEFIPVASNKSVGKEIIFINKIHKIINIETAVQLAPEIAIFSAGSELSLQFAPEFEKKGTYVIDNSSAWRMDKSKKLIIPEINAEILDKTDKIIANPNCSTIQMLMVLAPLHKQYTVKRVIVSTYQSVTGTGVKALKQLENEEKNIAGETVYPYQIYRNCLAQCDAFTENGYTKEEMKLVNETKKILDSKINVSATAVRVPVTGGHSESVNIEFESEFELSEVRKILEESPGIIVQDDINNSIYPMPISSEGKNEVFVGRIRRDFSNPKSLNLWIVSDNLRKGAATNAIQIAEYVIRKFF
jgi:aspartate-semialdehyde dehydrogenase